jgi:hypothetical protein
MCYQCDYYALYISILLTKDIVNHTVGINATNNKACDIFISNNLRYTSGMTSIV